MPGTYMLTYWAYLKVPKKSIQPLKYCDKETKVLQQRCQAIKNESNIQGPMLKHFSGLEFKNCNNSLG